MYKIFVYLAVASIMRLEYYQQLVHQKNRNQRKQQKIIIYIRTTNTHLPKQIMSNTTLI